MNANEKTCREIVSLLKDWAKAYERRDMKAVLARCSEDPDLTMIGTGMDETCIGATAFQKALSRDFSQAKDVSLTFKGVRVSGVGEVAWVVANCEVKASAAGQEFALTGRFTAVLENREGKWYIAQTHLSAPNAHQKAGQSF